MYFSKELLIQPYAIDTVLAEYSSYITTNINIKITGKYEVIFVGAGGGGARDSAAGSWFCIAGGGSGAAFRGVIKLLQGEYRLYVGGAGAGRTSESSGGYGGTGGITGLKLITNGFETNAITVNGGAGGFGEIYGGVTGGGTAIGGNGGTVNINTNLVSIYTTTQNTSGDKGQEYITDWRGLATAYGGASKYNGYGNGGLANISYGGYGTDGYLKIIYKGAY